MVLKKKKDKHPPQVGDACVGSRGWNEEEKTKKTFLNKTNPPQVRPWHIAAKPQFVLLTRIFPSSYQEVHSKHNARHGQSPTSDRRGRVPWTSWTFAWRHLDQCKSTGVDREESVFALMNMMTTTWIDLIIKSPNQFITDGLPTLQVFCAT